MTWPRDYLRQTLSIEKREHLVVFVLSPFSDQFNDLFELVEDTCTILSQQSNMKIIANRADLSSHPTTIHDDIWKGITKSDVIIADVTGNNGNVMIELGITSAIRERHDVIIIRERESDEMKFLFDISPERHIVYERTYKGFGEFRNRLLSALQFSLTPAPYIPDNQNNDVVPEEIDCRDIVQAKYLLGPVNGHRRMITDGLEFGSFVVFLNSWLTFGNKNFDNVDIQLKMRFSQLHPDPDVKHGWIGLSLRSVSPYANMGHLVYVQRDSKLMMTVPISEYHKSDDKELGEVEEVTLDQLYNFNIKFDDYGMKGDVNGCEFDIPCEDMAFVRNAGPIRLQTYLCRACIESMSVKML